MRIRNRTGHAIKSMAWGDAVISKPDVTRDLDGNVYISIWNEQMMLTPAEAAALGVLLCGLEPPNGGTDE